MERGYFVTDMAVDDLESRGIVSLAERKKLPHGILLTKINVRDNELSERVNRPKGQYVTFDADKLDESACAYLKKLISSSVLELLGILPDKATILAVGLGNPDVTADALGAETVGKLNATRGGFISRGFQVCTLTAGVAGVTGVKSQELITALCDKIKPSAVVLIDTLATSSPLRIGTSFQLTTAGIAPGSGVGGDKTRLDKSVLGVPTVALGVPMVLSMRTVVGNFVREYVKSEGIDNDEFHLRAALADSKLSTLVVSPKEIKGIVKIVSEVIADGLNRAFD